MNGELAGKTVVIGITGSIAAYKTASLVSALKKEQADVRVIMTQNACRFIAPLTLETLSGAPVITDMWERAETFDVAHVSLAKKASLFVVAPASANFLAKAAHGIADDFLSTFVLSNRAPMLLAPAMNSAMLESPAVRENIETLRRRGASFVFGGAGVLACGDVGSGRMAEPELLFEHIRLALARPHDLAGVRFLVTVGRTEESIDPVRYISNRSSGKMGYAIAGEAALRGAEVTVIAGETDIEPPLGIKKLISVRSAADMLQAALAEYERADIIIKTAAVADYTPAHVAAKKLKKTEGIESIRLVETTDIAAELGKRKGGRVLVAFAAETNDLERNAIAKLEKKNLDFIVGNDVSKAGIGFGADDNEVTLYFLDGRVSAQPKMPKIEVARVVVDAAAEALKAKSTEQ